MFLVTSSDSAWAKKGINKQIKNKDMIEGLLDLKPCTRELQTNNVR